jgi:hypothetical protein
MPRIVPPRPSAAIAVPALCEPAAVRSEPGVPEAAANNAAWCDRVARTHGIVGVFATDAWTAPERTPPLYPDAVTLRPDVDARALLARIDTGSGASVKDSFATLDLAPYEFSVLFDATWIARAPATGSLTGDTLRLAAMTDAELPVWETAWRGDHGAVDVMRSELLEDPNVTALAALDDDGSILGGAMLFATVTCVGVSNAFAASELLDALWRGIVAWVELHTPGTALVGYESDPDLAAAQRVGFVPVAPLRVWMRD